MKIGFIWLGLIGVVIAWSPECNAKKPPLKDLPRWADSEVFSGNKEPAHAFSLLFSDEESARSEPNWDNPFSASSRYKMLNGSWKFRWSENPSSAPSDFYRTSFDASAWEEIHVPLPWQLAGYGQLYYFNAALPMVGDPRNRVEPIQEQANDGSGDILVNAKVPENFLEAALSRWVPTLWNPVGSYRRTFIVPGEWSGQRVVLHFSGVKSAFTCWVNGREVGYSQDSFSASEFDITEYLQSGENVLAMQVIRWSDGTYQEVQDMIRMSGIFRDVYLFATPKAHVGDFHIVADVAESLNQASFSVDVQLRNTGNQPASKRSVEVELIDSEGKAVFRKRIKVPTTATGKDSSVVLEAQIDQPLLWHPAHPHLYTALIKLLHNGRIEEVIREDVGFRRFDWDDQGNMFLNGNRYMMRGVNRHDHSQKTGRTVSYEEMLEDVIALRRLNINNVRNSHYPRDPRWYALCNRFGITLIDECNLESHPAPQIYSDPESEPLWREQTLFRMRNMVAANRNQPSVLIWSLGNEQFESKELPIAKSLYDLTKSLDSTRGVFSERMYSDADDKNLGPYLDFIGPMYRGTAQYARWHQTGQDRRPFFMSEYAHAMGNSMADLAPLWKTFEDNPGMNGGQIWDWADQGLLLPLPGLEGKHWTYGGDWGAYGSGRVFCMNGIVLPDRSFNGKSYEVKSVYQQVAFSAVDDEPGKVQVINKFATQNLENFDIQWKLLENGKSIKNGTLEISVPPLTEQIVALPFGLPQPTPGRKYHVNFDVKLRQATSWAEAGYTIAQNQVPLGIPFSPAPEMKLSEGRVSVHSKGNRLRVQAGNVVVDFDRSAAVLSQVSVGGKDLLAPGGSLSGVELNVNSWLTDDRLVWPGAKIWSGLQAGMNKLNRYPVSLELIEKSEGICRIRAVANHLVPEGQKGVRHTATYTLLNSGTIQIDNLVQKMDLASDALCFRIGVRLPIGKEFGIAEYAAFGPQENYDARNAAARFGQYVQPAAEMFGKYVRPQECGNRSGLTWLALRNEAGVGLLVVPAKAGDGSVMPCTREEMEGIRHVPELPESTRWILRYDAQQAILPKNSNVDFEGDTAFSYSIRPLQPGQDASVVALPVVPPRLTVPPVLTGKAASSSFPDDWVLVSKDSTLEYSSTSPWAILPDTLLTTQASTFAFHTKEETTPWLMIDLGRRTSVAGIDILNRADAQGSRTRNLRVWLSDDRRDWEEVFRADAPQPRWRVALDQPVKARYVKIGLVNNEPTFFHLRGIQVFGSRHRSLSGRDSQE